MRFSWKELFGQDEKPSEPEVPDEITTREFAAPGSLLQLLTMDADAVIKTGGENISVTVTGRQSVLDKLIVDNTNGLSITSQRPNINLSIKINGKSIWRLLGDVLSGKVVDTIVNYADKYKLKITATVPVGTDLVLNDYDGSVEADGVYGEVKAGVSYDTKLRLDRLTMLDVQSDSGLDLTVKGIEGNARIETSYDSKVKILSGVLSEFFIRTDSGADVLVKARCSEATASSSYDCTFRFGVITSQLTVNADSGCKVYFDCDEANQVDVQTSYDCTITATGKTRRAIIRTDSGCHVTLGAVTDKLDAECSYDCSLVTTEGTGTRYVAVQMDSDADVQLIGTIEAGHITTSYGSSVLVGVLGSGVRTNFDGDTQLSTGYMSVN
jgi:hypothetical protein